MNPKIDVVARFTGQQMDVRSLNHLGYNELQAGDRCFPVCYRSYNAYRSLDTHRSSCVQAQLQECAPKHIAASDTRTRHGLTAGGDWTRAAKSLRSSLGPAQMLDFRPVSLSSWDCSRLVERLSAALKAEDPLADSTIN